MFGTQISMPVRPRLGPSDVRARFAERVGDEMDFPEFRLVRSIQVEGAEVICKPRDDQRADIALMFPNGASALVEVKVQQRDFKSKELGHYWANLREAHQASQVWHEIWNFNIERLRLTIVWINETGLPEYLDLDPLNVWEFNEDGSIFDRAILIMRIENWLHRIEEVYTAAKEWAEQAGLAVSRTRTILMSEELMQRFAIPDRELHILDFDRNGVPMMSMVPVGLWIIGGNGRIDLITPNQTAVLIDLAEPMTLPNWMYREKREDRVFRPWNEAAFHEITRLDTSA